MAKRKHKPDPSPTIRPESPWPRRLRTLRAKLGNLTQAQAAARFRVSIRSWVGWEAGEQIPSAPVQLLVELAEAGKF